MKTPLRIAAVGDNCIDCFQTPPAYSVVGGNAVNVAVQLARLGCQSFYFGAVGDDAAGKRTIALLAENDVNVQYIQCKSGKTASTQISIDSSGDRIIVDEDFGACSGYAPSAHDLAVLETMDHVHIGWLDDGGRLRRHLTQRGVSVSQDLGVNNDPAHLEPHGLTIAFGSAGENAVRATKLLAAYLAAGAHKAVVTCGSAGAIAHGGDGEVRTGSRKTNVVDTTGAGDSFIAGFLVAFLHQKGFDSCLIAGRDCAAVTCSHLGGFRQSLIATDL